jgi:phosphate transport system permease protein
MTTANPAAVGSVRERVLAASSRIRRVKAVDRLATAVITFGGMFIILSVLFIFLFIFGQTLPLFRSAQGRSLGVLPLPVPPAAAPAGLASAAPEAARPLLVGVDEYQMYIYQLLSDGRLALFRAKDGSFARDLPIPSLAAVQLTSASRSAAHDFVATGTTDGRVALLQVRFLPRYEEQRLVDLDVQVEQLGVVELDADKRAVLELDAHQSDTQRVVAGRVADDEILLYRRNEGDGTEHRDSLKTRDGERVTRLRIGRGEALVAGTATGSLYYWELAPELRLAEVKQGAARQITALEWALGQVSILVGDDAGAVSAWLRVRQKDEDPEPALVRSHQFQPQAGPVHAIAISTRDKSFASSGADGALVLRHLTSERSLIAFPATGKAPRQALITPKSDGVLVLREDGQLARYEISNPHPEVSWRALFGKVWYEGYARPEYVWQSTGATDDFESKFSLVPLVFGTIKATAYAMLFAVPIAILAALYTSQFAHPSVKARIKPAVEIMAALPSVVVGFIAGLWLASKVEREIVPVLLMLAVLPAIGTAGILLWDRLPHGFRRGLRPGMELLVIVPLLIAGAGLALLIGPGVESAGFGGDFKGWLGTSLGLVYDQRNSLVVGLAMGFAVIPIIFTISEDSFSSVPSHLTAASLALGASRWQTAVRVVLPTASPGIFSAVMVGFGRAVGETMIVLMATGNTPVLDWSIFNGMRTLSANIAVEIPEAPQGGTLYRVLFLAGGVLFLMTFAVNTVAEVIRQRLRERYKAI